MTTLLSLGNLAIAQSDFCNLPSANLQLMPQREKALVIIDTSLEDYQTLVEGVIPGHEVYLLEAHQCGITQITQILREQIGIASLHLLSHGRSGELQLGSSVLNLDNLLAHKAQLQVWRSALAENAEILLYGCEVAQGEWGKAFVNTLSQLTGADIAASANLTGNAAKGGDWVLYQFSKFRLQILHPESISIRQSKQSPLQTSLLISLASSLATLLSPLVTSISSPISNAAILALWDLSRENATAETSR